MGDEVIVPNLTFVATAAAAIAVNAIPVFCDVDPRNICSNCLRFLTSTDTFNIDPHKIESYLSSRTRAIIVVHLGGMPCEMDKIMQIAKV